MFIAVLSSNGVTKIDLDKFMPPCTTRIIYFGEKELTADIKDFLGTRNIILNEFLLDPVDYDQNTVDKVISKIKKAFILLAFWDGKKGLVESVIDACNRDGFPVKVFV